MRKILLFVFMALLLIQTKTDYTIVTLGNLTIKAEIADNEIEWTKGLMFREKLGENEGMLFVFNDEKSRTFWMKNTKIPLDIIFLSENFTIVDIRSMHPCVKDPCETYTSKYPARYVLEVNAGSYTKSIS